VPILAPCWRAREGGEEILEEELRIPRGQETRYRGGSVGSTKAAPYEVSRALDERQGMKRPAAVAAPAFTKHNVAGPDDHGRTVRGEPRLGRGGRAEDAERSLTFALGTEKTI